MPEEAAAAAGIFERDLAPNPINHMALSPLSFLRRSSRVWPGKTAVI